MAKKVTNIQVKDTLIRTMQQNGIDYVCITDIARQKNAEEPKDVVKNWMRLKNTIEYIGLWEKLNNPQFKGVGFDPLLQEAGSNAFTLSPTKWIEQTNAIGIVCTTGRNGGTYAQRDIAFKFANWVSVEFELYLVKEFQRLKEEEQKQIGWSVSKSVGQSSVNSQNSTTVSILMLSSRISCLKRLMRITSHSFMQKRLMC